MTETLSEKEISRMERGLLRLSEWGEDLLVPFPVRQLRNASLLWLNRRWFLERGIDITDTDTLDRVETWLVATFGYISPAADDKAATFTHRTKIAHADRYGSSGGTAPHGGSGRAAIYGCFQAKGVGITPLVGVSASLGHAHGCASLAEGIREAIYAEIVASEFPHGAIPVIALIDTGLYFSSPDRSEKYDQDVRRAIVVRPCVLRPAHAERAALFSQSVTGYANSQASDAKRTRDVVRRWSFHGNHEETSGIPSLRETLGRAAEQAAFGQVHRLFNGGYFSSNLSVTGELLDFGNMHALPDWSNARVLGHAAGFGRELEAIDVLARSLDFHFRKYCEPNRYRDSAESLIAYAKARYRNGFARECLRLWQADNLADSDEAEEIVRLTRAYFSDQQRKRRRYEFGLVVGKGADEASDEWLYDVVAKNFDLVNARHRTPASRVLEDVVRCLKRGFQTEPNPESRLWVSWITALRLLRPRNEVDRSALLQRIKNLMFHLNFAGQGSADRIADLIQKAVDHGRAHWPRLPSGLGVLAHVTRDGCSALLCSPGPSVPRQLWIQGIRLGGRVRLFDSWLPAEALGELDADVHGEYCSFLATGDGAGRADGFLLRLGPHEIRIPAMSNRVSFGVGGAVRGHAGV